MIRLALRVRRADAEIVLAELLGLVPGGVEERDVDADVVEYAVYGAPGELPALPDLRAAAGGALVDVVTTEVADDWADRWREFHPRSPVGGRVHVRAPWHPAVSADVAPVEVVIDPGQAFGTGAHATTRLCLELLLALEPSGAARRPRLRLRRPRDRGRQARLGPVLGVDHDPLAVAATRENARVNGVEIDGAPPRPPPRRPGAVGPDGARQPPRPAAAARGGRRLRGVAPRALIASGLLVAEADEIAAAFAAARSRRDGAAHRGRVGRAAARAPPAEAAGRRPARCPVGSLGRWPGVS